MAGLKRHDPGILFSGVKVTPDEIDRYEVYSLTPANNIRFWASAGTAGTASTIALTVLNRLPDYPRNIEFVLAGSATGMAGTLKMNGRDQFGNSISENFGFGSADNGGTVIGTKVFAQLLNGTLYYGTAIGNGTPQIGFGTMGTTTLFGLPTKLGGTSDVVHIGMTFGTGAITVGNGTIAAFVNVPMHAIMAPATIDGTAQINVWFRTTYDASNDVKIAGGTQVV